MIRYRAHCANFGWQEPVTDGQIAGTIGENRALEAFRVEDLGVENLGIHAFAHVQDLGWSEGNLLNEDVGSTGLGKHIEAVKIGLIGERANDYDLFYRLHVQDTGFLNWSKNGELNGTVGGNKQAEAIQMLLVKRGENIYPVSDTDKSFIDLTPPPQPARDIRAELIAQAQSYIGYVSGTSNDSVFGRRYAGANAGSWCAYFVRNCCDNVGVNFPKTGYCPTVVEWAKENGRWLQTPEPGFWVLFDFNGNGTSDHIGIVENCRSRNNITAIEGNTSGGAGIGVYRKTRTSGILGFVNPF